MKALLVLAAGLLAVTAVAGAEGVTKPGRSRTEGAPIVALSVTGRSVTYAVADNASKSDCAHAYFWHTAGGAIGKWRFGKPTNEPCVEGPSTGDGISAVAMSAERSLWIQYAGGNLRDWQLFTATQTKTKPKQLAFVEQDVELPSPIVVGQGMQDGVPYAVNANLTFLGDNGAAIFKWTAPAAVKLLASGFGPNGSEVAAFLSNGTLDLLSHSGQVVQSYTYSPGELTALYLGPAGVVALGRIVRPDPQGRGDPDGHPAREGADDRLRPGRDLLLARRGDPRTEDLEQHRLAARRGHSRQDHDRGLRHRRRLRLGDRQPINWDCAACVNFGP